ncbi:MAG: efflux RND transporter periplasmic adaptor subunit [Magnetococcales bacterium]|nr:efflux RND transporter periplasmic adaptor subunit [Magnetococcales bacterium]
MNIWKGLFGLALALTLGGCSSGGESQGPPKDKPVLVTSARVERKSVPVELSAHGHLAPCASVALKSRVDGQIVEAPFQEGAEVDAGALLFVLDGRAFAIQLDQLKANLARDQAQLQLARTQEARRRELLQAKTLSADQFAPIETARQTAEAAVLAGAAAIRAVELTLDHTHIHAPLAGRVGRQFRKVGELVKANDPDPLAVIHQMDPLCLDFAVPERHLPHILTWQGKNPLPVTFTLPDGTAGEGRLAWIDNAVDRTTGTIGLHARIPNPQRRFWPGQFVPVTLRLQERDGVVVAPTPALQTGPNGRFVFLVRPDRTVAVQPVTVERENERDAVVTAGLEGGEVVVVTGQWRLTDGARVEVTPPVTRPNPG